MRLERTCSPASAAETLFCVALVITGCSPLSLDSAPYVVADSMGGFTMLNAISAGVLQNGAVYAATPFELWASYSDTVVPRGANTDRFAAMVSASGGSIVVNTSSGEHLDSSNFDPEAVVAFFNAH